MEILYFHANAAQQLFVIKGIIEFHRKDQSPEFQDTDALIEKSVRFSADMARSGTLDSAFDLGRFLMRRFTLPGS